MDDFSAFFNLIWFWLIVILVIQPWLQKHMLHSQRRGVLERIAKKRKSAVITLIHRQETVSFFGIPITRYIDIEDSEDVLRAIRNTPEGTPIDLIIHTPGGIALAASQIAMALKSHKGKKTVIIPHYAMSGGTLIALAADEILMDPHAVIGPVDPQLSDPSGTYPAATLLKVLEKKNVNDLDDKTLVMAEEARKAIKQMEDFVRKLLEDSLPKEKIEEVLDELVRGKYTHDHGIFPEEAQRLLPGKVKIGLPEEVYELMALYKMEARPRRPGVEYVPVIPSHPIPSKTR